jgi:hypothetical protein
VRHVTDLPVDPTPIVRGRLPGGPISAAGGLLAAAAYVAAIDPSEGGVFPTCPFRAMTGWWCAGCGLTRATHRLLHGDVFGALRFNALTPLILALIALLWLDWYVRATKKRSLLRRAPRWSAVTGIVVAVAFAVLRNLPGVAGLRG